jgi:hypothetical protein
VTLTEFALQHYDERKRINWREGFRAPLAIPFPPLSLIAIFRKGSSTAVATVDDGKVRFAVTV